ncbi:Glycosyl transferase family 2 [Marininema mesophilum]|uniref:Glycosyl transferase family 2 n=1 Tax=Marininema mesophilum TaxID=1048340 RepID=A0A1H2TI52_9BACL|nr:glycosyltransferase family A protein [Marininema mesophilum]SDW43355.1 Glycosyl transferase family 2 [Marininema mesophilum]
MGIKLSILIPSIPGRLTHLARMVSELERQSQQLPVEILVLIDNKKSSIGVKRNVLLNQAQGEFITFVDDDDRVETDYIHTLLETIYNHPDADCIPFDVEVNLSGLSKKICKYDIQYSHSEDDHYYYRKPNHIMCYAKKIAVKHKYMDINYGEDDEWAERASKLVQKQIKIDKVLYYYDYVLKRPSDNPGLRMWENQLMSQNILGAE